ncbi:hypothetical protein MPER_07572, partial [Moniliophthora perniciosa FA553]
TTRPTPSGIPSTLSYGGNPFDITVPASSYSGSANTAAENTHVAVVRPGWTTHAMNMGQRYLQLNNTFTVNNDGSLILHTAQMPPNANIFQPGPAWVYVVVNGIPSKGTYVIVGSGNVEAQTLSAASVLPDSVRLDSAKGSADGSTTGNGGSNSNGAEQSSKGKLIAVIVGGVVALGLIGAVIGICLSRRRRAANRQDLSASSASYPMSAAPASPVTSGGYGHDGYGRGQGYGGASDDSRGLRGSDSSVFVPFKQDYNSSQQWGASNTNLVDNQQYDAYRDHNGVPQYRSNGMSMELDPYAAESRMSTSSPHGGRSRY